MADMLRANDLQNEIKTVEMHTCGEPIRIIYAGYPELRGTLLEQRAQAKREYDHIRRRLILEPRGHFDMYGAILRHDTELTGSGDAHVGVLFLTNDGYSTMCGHATIALGRFLVDAAHAVLPRRNRIERDPSTKTALLKLHAPCGIIEVTVPTNDSGTQSDPSRGVSFISVPSFATGIDITIPIPSYLSWPELEGRNTVCGSFSYGGAFYCMTDVKELGFSDLQPNVNFSRIDYATRQLTTAVNSNPGLRRLVRHAEHQDLSFLYSIMVTDVRRGEPMAGSNGAETGLCFFADQQVDRSPTGGAVAARVALDYARGQLKLNERWTYHSMLFNQWDSRGAFVGCAVEEIGKEVHYPVVRVRVEGHAYYTGYSTFFVEATDPLGDDGFVFGKQSATVRE